ncbi:cysteine desulfurase-like protein [Veronia pacifica]|uniref:Cysteine desulfurase-like protein n=1 Tax=Veronia pacifica TaxID=1080227 RepID=A0A1C3EKU0_9GAMM|nr:cysteine desulfurase-like protein [Veronia pacifica]ODA33858.1 cysteine desulfurase-like protein [Veronia pacifica]
MSSSSLQIKCNINTIRANFPALQQTINGFSPAYFDGPGGTQLPKTVQAAFADYLASGNSNLGGQFSVSRNTVELVNTAREHAAAMFNASTRDEMVFGANMTSMTLHFSRSIAREWQAGDEIILSDADHGANRSCWAMAAEEKGVKVHYLPVTGKTCELDINELDKLLNDKTRLVAVTAASNLSGTTVDIHTVVKKAKAAGALAFIDAVHLLPHQLVDVQTLGADFVAASAYKFFGPHLGIMWGRSELLNSLTPYKVEPAPGYAPNCWETGTLNFEAISAFVQAVRYLASLGTGDDLREQLVSAYGQIHSYEHELSQYFLTKLKTCPGIQLVGRPEATGRTATFALRFNELTPSEVAAHLGEQEIYVWTGHLYADRLTDALGITDKGGILRVGLMHYNTVEEIDRLFVALDNLGVCQ